MVRVYGFAGPQFSLRQGERTRRGGGQNLLADRLTRLANGDGEWNNTLTFVARSTCQSWLLRGIFPSSPRRAPLSQTSSCRASSRKYKGHSRGTIYRWTCTQFSHIIHADQCKYARLTAGFGRCASDLAFGLAWDGQSSGFS